jgi:predicted DNA-binding transcriptional regulator AlpA
MKFDSDSLTPSTSHKGIGGTGAAGRTPVSLSKWVNEKLPALSEVLSAHDVARLTRRRPWVVHTLTWLSRFPKQQRFHNRRIGWARRDVVAWLDADGQSRRRIRTPRQLASVEMRAHPASPLHVSRTRRSREPCSARRVRGEP